MLVFIDESGDAGFKQGAGSSPLFVVGMVVFHSVETAQRTVTRVEEIARHCGHRSEFKFSACRPEIRGEFFVRIAVEAFQVRALVVDKSAVRSDQLRSISDRFYSHFLQLLLRQQGQTFRDADIVIDGSGSQEFRSKLRTAIRAQLPLGAVRKVRMRNSSGDRLLQLADMCVGAIYRARRPDGKRDSSWLQMLAARIDCIDDFK